MEAGGRGTASGCRHAIDATGERDYLVDVRQEGVLMQRISEYSAPGMGLPPHVSEILLVDDFIKFVCY